MCIMHAALEARHCLQHLLSIFVNSYNNLKRPMPATDGSVLQLERADSIYSCHQGHVCSCNGKQA